MHRDVPTTFRLYAVQVAEERQGDAFRGHIPSQHWYDNFLYLEPTALQRAPGKAREYQGISLFEIWS